MGPWKAGRPRLDSYLSGSSPFSVEESGLRFPHRPTWTCLKPENSNNLHAKETSLLSGSGVVWLVHKCEIILTETSVWFGVKKQTETPHVTPLFYFSAIPWACCRDYNHCVLLCICYYKSNNGRSGPTEAALCFLLLLVWCIGSNYSYKRESWQTWPKMDAKIQLSGV